MLRATATLGGDPVAYCFGPVPSQDGGAVTVGLFMVCARIEAEALDFENPDTGERLRLRVPVEGRGLLADGWAENVHMEVVPT